LFLLLVVGAVIGGGVPSTSLAVSPNIDISQVYGGAGCGTAGCSTYQNDYLELFNRGASSVSVNGWSVQYAAATGTAWQVTSLPNVSIPAGKYLLVGESFGANGVNPLPTPDVTGTIAMSATAAKVALVNVTTALSGACPSSATIVDFVGYGTTANCAETANAPAPSTTTADLRGGAGCTDTDNNSTDFSAGAPNPRNTASPATTCGADIAPSVTSTTPANGASGVAVAANVSVTFSEPVNVDSGWFSISCGSSGAHTAAESGGPTTFTLNPDTDFTAGESCTVTIVALKVHDQDANDPPDTMAADYVFSFTVGVVPIHTIQGAAHISPFKGMSVLTRGVVTAMSASGFWIQDPSPDADDATSEGLFVFTSSAPTVQLGDDVSVTGTVNEFRASANNLTTTEIGSPSVSVLSSGNVLPAAIVIGTGGRMPPTSVIEDDATGDVETSGTFDPATDGIDFYESLEGMRVQVNNPVSVAPTNSFNEQPVLPDDGAWASVRTARGGILVRATDFNPERVTLHDAVTAGSVPTGLNVGDHFSGGPAVGVLDYSFGNFMLELTSMLTRVDGGLARETTAAPAANELAIATFNVENLDPVRGGARFNDLASIIVNNLRSPDILGLEEIQDNNGIGDDGTVSADVTLDTLVSAISTVGGPTYQYTYINPVNDQDGGEPGGNIRQVFLYRTDRGVSFVSKPGGTSTTANTVGPTGLQYSPGRIDPTNSWFNSSRKPLAAEFMFAGQKLYVIVNHFNSKGGDQPLYGHFQPPTLSSEVQRNQQAQIVNNFVDSILSVDSGASIVVLGDLNDYPFSNPLAILEGSVLADLIDTLPQNERYGYVFEGNSQALDHILVSNHIATRAFTYDIVHVDSEFAIQASDHDPEVVQFDPISPVTAIVVGSLTARADRRGAVVRWRTGSEAGLLGFNVYRERDGRKVRATHGLIRAAGALRGRAYAWRDRPARAGARYWLELVHADGSRTWRGPVRAR
jgi:predicted extracellular nuclease